MKNQAIQKKKFTGKSLVLFNDSVKHDYVFKAAGKSSVRLAHFNDYFSHPEKYMDAFTEADGIYFGKLNVAVVNPEKKRELAFLDKEKDKSVIVTEPERFIYKIGHKKLMPGDFADDSESSWGIKAIRAIDSKYSGKGVNIAILDTGVFKGHVDLKSRKIVTKKLVSTGTAGDVDGHGSHCTGIACGKTDENGMRYGTAFEANIFCGKVLNDNGEGTDSGILAGIEWAIKKKCRVISMSLGAAAEPGEHYSETYENVAKRAIKQNVLIVAAAGNESNRPDMIAPVGHPANCPSIMAVGAIDPSIKIAMFSCGGINLNGGQIDVVAPGVSVYSMINKQHEHERWDGTSMATPFVAGIAALFCEQYPKATPLDIWSYITQFARRLNLNSSDVGSGLAQAPTNQP